LLFYNSRAFGFRVRAVFAGKVAWFLNLVE